MLLISLAKGTLNFPYIPGYLAFREMPILFKAWEQMQVKPDILMVDGKFSKRYTQFSLHSRILSFSRNAYFIQSMGANAGKA
ncbi:MAG: endonuclease V [Solitalea-like symbiont of Acarus siro]